jgi:hypothetical protein
LAFPTLGTESFWVWEQMVPMDLDLAFDCFLTNSS